MNTEMFLRLLLAMSILTSLFTQAIKAYFDSVSIKYCSNVIAGAVSIIIGIFVCVGYTICMNLTITTPIIISYIALTALSWVMAMIGYDKVVQALQQITRV